MLRDSNTARLLRAIFGCYFVVTVLVTAIQLAAEYYHTEERLLQEIRAMQPTFGPGITNATWRFNDDVLRGILSGIKELPIVIGLKVEDPRGKIVRQSAVHRDLCYRYLRAQACGSRFGAPLRSLAGTRGRAH